MKNKFIVLEGFDGSGKTKIGEYLNNFFDYKYIKTPGKQFEPIKEYIETRDPFTKLFYYYAGNFDISDKVLSLLNISNLVCDRYFYSSLAYFCFFNEYDISEVYNMMEKINSNLVHPDLIIYLTVPDEIRIKRLKGRKEAKEKTDEFFCDNIDKCFEMDKIFKNILDKYSCKTNYVIVDSSQSVEETCNKINKILSEL